MIKAMVESFNFVWDFVARLVALCFFVVAVGLLVRKWKFIDWGRTGKHLIERHSPFQMQAPERGTAPPSSKRVPQGQPGAEPRPAPEGPATDSQPTKAAHLPRPPAAPDYLNVYQFGQLVFTADRPYEITGNTLLFDKLLLKGRPDYKKPFLYAGREIMITRIQEYIGLLVSGGSVEGPVLRGVECTVLKH